MTRAVKQSVRDGVSAQMLIIARMSEELQDLYAEANRKQDPNLRRLAEEMAAQLADLTGHALNVGEVVLAA